MGSETFCNMHKMKISLLLFFIYVFLLISCNPVSLSTQSVAIPSPTTVLIPATVPKPTSSKTIKPVAVQSPSSNWFDNLPNQNNEKIYGVTVSKDNAIIALYTSLGIYLYNGHTVKQESFIDNTSIYSSENHLPIAFSPDGKFLAFANENAIILWNIGASQETISIAPPSVSRAFYIEFNPNGDRIILTSYVSGHYDGSAINFSLYNLDGNLLFEKYFPGDFSNYYYRLTTDEKLYIFYNSMYSEEIPLELYVVDTRTGHLLDSIVYDFETNSYNSENAFYDISPDGKVGAVSVIQDGKYKTRLVDAQTQDILNILDYGIIEFLPQTKADDIAQWQKFTKPVRRSGWLLPSYNIVQQCNLQVSEEVGFIPFEKNKALLLIPSFREIKAIEIWNTSTCHLENGIALSVSE